MTMTTADPRVDPADTGPVNENHDAGNSPRADRPRRRQFTAEYKLSMVAAYDAAGPGAKGELLRREGLYSSHIVEWRKASDAGALTALTARTRPARKDAKEVDNEWLRRRAERAEAELAKTRAALEVVGKAHAVGLRHEQLLRHLSRQLADIAATAFPTRATPSV